jgi:uncharacterized protein (TIGR00369 family)
MEHESNEWTELLDRVVARKLAPGEAEPPFVETLKVPYPDAWEPGRVTATWPVDQRFFNERGVLFGGFLAALSDHILGMATMSVLEAGEAFTTSDLRTSFFRPVTGGTLKLDARVVHRSRNMVHVEVQFVREDDKLVAKATATQVILRTERIAL